jgi:hypothetical protein
VNIAQLTLSYFALGASGQYALRTLSIGANVLDDSEGRRIPAFVDRRHRHITPPVISVFSNRSAAIAFLVAKQLNEDVPKRKRTVIEASHFTNGSSGSLHSYDSQR